MDRQPASFLQRDPDVLAALGPDVTDHRLERPDGRIQGHLGIYRMEGAILDESLVRA